LHDGLQSSAEMADAYAYEVALEAAEEQKRLHRPMKAWYASAEQAHLAALHGAFPQFWRDLAGWTAWSAVMREYNRFLEKGPVAASAAPAVVQPEAASAPPDAAGEQPAAAPTEDGAAPARKRRRWGDTVDAPPASGGGEGAAAAGGDEARRRTRWMGEVAAAGAGAALGQAVEVCPPTLPPMPPVSRGRCRWGARAISSSLALLPPGCSPMQEALFVYRVRVEEIQLRLSLVPMEAARQAADPARSPSPEPEYDSNGKKLNGREARLAKALTEKRDRLLERMMDLNPALAGPTGPKFVRRLFIPWRDYPNYNFIGLIIGPRGNTQKKLEKETNCKISVRGRGSGKDAKMADGNPSAGSARNPKRAEEDDMEMHVMVTAERLAHVEQAAALISDLLHPVDDDTNEWKKRQLVELAAMNGTLRDINAPCSRCGEPGHRHFECPYAEAGAKRIAIRCALCGDGSHVTADCKLRNGGGEAGSGGGAGGGADVAMESEYLSFMADMGDGSAKARLEAIAKAKAEAEARAGGAKPASAAPTGGAGGGYGGGQQQSMAPIQIPTPVPRVLPPQPPMQQGWGMQGGYGPPQHHGGYGPQPGGYGPPHGYGGGYFAPPPPPVQVQAPQQAYYGREAQAAAVAAAGAPGHAYAAAWYAQQAQVQAAQLAAQQAAYYADPAAFAAWAADRAAAAGMSAAPGGT